MQLPERLPTRLFDALINVASATEIPSYDLARSIFGDGTLPAEVPPGFRRELDAVTTGPWAERALTVARATLSFPGSRALLGHPSGPRALPDHELRALRPDERWFFMNGVCSDLRMAELNRAELGRFSGRPIQLLYNATDGVLLDLFECAVGKTLDAVTDAVVANFAPLAHALCEPEITRVVLVCHSQGTIISSVMLKLLQQTLLPHVPPVPLVGTARPSAERRVANALLDERPEHEDFNAAVRRLGSEHPDVLDKLELYCFANCASSMEPFHSVGAPLRRVPFIESYGNEYDAVARLGVLAAARGIGGTNVDGDRYYVRGAWGHFLNAHYLAPMYTAMARPEARPGEPGVYSPFPSNLRRVPRFWGYAGGAQPA
jgi:hypothetical protein